MPELTAPEEDEIVTVALDPNAWMRVTVLISFALSVIFTLMYLLSGGGSQLFDRTVILRTYCADGTGLVKKGLVEVDGIKVGHIESVELSHSNEPTRIVRVNVAISQRYLPSIPVDSRTEITADNLLGDKYINIRKGIASEYVKAGDELLAQPPSNNFNPADLIQSLESILKRTNTILDQIDDPKSELGQLVQGELLYDQIRDDIIGIQKTIHGFGNPTTPAGQAIFGSELYEQLRKPIIDIDKQLMAIESGEGALGHAFASTGQYDQLHAQIVSFRKSVAELRGNKLLTSDELHDQLLLTFQELDAVITSMSHGPMFDNAQLYESLNGSSNGAEKFLREFRNNPRKFLRIKVF